MKFADVVRILDKSVGGPEAQVFYHGAFWRDVTRDEFVAMEVDEVPLVVVGDGANSSLVLSLKGDGEFGRDRRPPPPEACMPRMPAFLPPVSAEEINDIEQWINDGCPDG